MTDKLKQLAEEAGLKFSKENPQHIECEGWHSIQKLAESIAFGCFKATMKDAKGQVNPLALVDAFEKETGVRPVSTDMRTL